MNPNSFDSLAARRDAGTLTWSASLLMLFARAASAVAAQGIVAGSRPRTP